MQQWIGLALAIQWRASRHDEAHTLVETECLPILFVDVHPGRPLAADGMGHQQASDATASCLGCEKQHLDIAIVHAAKTGDTCVVPGTDQIDGREIVLQDQRLEGIYLRLWQKVVSGAHRG